MTFPSLVGYASYGCCWRPSTVSVSHPSHRLSAITPQATIARSYCNPPSGWSGAKKSSSTLFVCGYCGCRKRMRRREGGVPVGDCRRSRALIRGNEASVVSALENRSCDVVGCDGDGIAIGGCGGTFMSSSPRGGGVEGRGTLSCERVQRYINTTTPKTRILVTIVARGSSPQRRYHRHPKDGVYRKFHGLNSQPRISEIRTNWKA